MAAIVPGSSSDLIGKQSPGLHSSSNMTGTQ